MERKGYNVEFEPLGRRGRFHSDQSLLEAAQQLGLNLISLCGGEGRCQRCKIHVSRGKVSSDPIQPNLLACRTFPASDVIVYVPPESLSTPQRVQVEGDELPVRPDPLVKDYEINLPVPDISDVRADDRRLIQALREQWGVGCEHMDREVAKGFSRTLRSCQWKVICSLRGSEIIAVRPIPSRPIGLAVDLGTTKIAGYLMDLQDGKTLAHQGIMNPQLAYGEDIISRLNLARKKPEDAWRMQDLALNSINRLANELSAEAGLRSEDILETVVVANTAMHHILLGLPVEQLIYAPYVPSVAGALDVKARDLGIHVSRGSYVHTLPNVAGFIGADHVAMVISTGIYQAKSLILALDIGTNTEICLSDHGKMASVSCASGPAFEGAHITCGMRAAAGAIEHLCISEGNMEYLTIERADPVGLCGSGILEAIAQMFISGVIDKNGYMTEDHPRVRSRNKEREFVVLDETQLSGRRAITVTQRDIREIQLAKAAIRAGIQVLLESGGHSQEDLDQIIVAGAFGNYLDISSAVTIGMLPPLPLERFRQVGNAAGAGAKAALISSEKRGEAQRIAREIHYMELAGNSGFNQKFIEMINFG